jgi:hypothetical protein
MGICNRNLDIIRLGILQGYLSGFNRNFKIHSLRDDLMRVPF